MLTDGHDVGIAVLNGPTFYLQHERFPHVRLEQTERFIIQELSVYRRRHAVGDFEYPVFLALGIGSTRLERHKKRLALEFVDSSLVGCPPQSLHDNPELHLKKVPRVAAFWLDELLDDVGHGLGDNFF